MEVDLLVAVAAAAAQRISLGMSQTIVFSIQREVQLRFLGPDDIAEVKRLCMEWFPIE